MKPRFLNNPKYLLYMMSIAMTLAFATWMVLLNNFVVERAEFSGREIGILQSIREIPGFLAFTTIFVLLLIREQKFAYFSLIMLGIGVLLTGFFPSEIGLYCTTLLMSAGFHYFETVKQSLSLQWLSVSETPEVLGKLIAITSLTSLLTYLFIWFSQEYLSLGFEIIYLISGVVCLLLTVFMWFGAPSFEGKVNQKKNLVLKRSYWLYYALTFMSGARRQIFVVFAAFLMVEKFKYSVSDIAILFIINHTFNWIFASKIGRLVGKVGERSALTFEYCGLFLIFFAYAYVDSAIMAGALYVLDHLFFSLAIAIKTYFQKIADPSDIASTAGVAFTINHIAAVFIPVSFGLVWLFSPKLVFLMGAMMSLISLILARNIPKDPKYGHEVIWDIKGGLRLTRL
tara:strand:- start:1041 stop:2237 length:1197 start_codon:yes stop_codon:yes gene_type:complete